MTTPPSGAVPAPAERYRGRPDIAVVAAFFNPCGYGSRRANALAFLRSLEGAGITWRCVECAFGDRGFELPESRNILRVRSASVLWQKERLLNHAVRTLPERVSKVAWLDGDVLFCERDWLARASESLAHHAVVQPFTEAVRLARGGGPSGHQVSSFARRFRAAPNVLAWRSYWDHGQTGLAWAGRRDWIERHGLYDACLSGIGDHLMAHAFVGNGESWCLRLRDGPFPRHFRRWAGAAYPDIRGRVGYLDGTVLSLWHGERADRNYHAATNELQDLVFDPDRDLRRAPGGCWEWGRQRPALSDWSARLFQRRNEDGGGR